MTIQIIRQQWNKVFESIVRLFLHHQCEVVTYIPSTDAWLFTERTSEPRRMTWITANVTLFKRVHFFVLHVTVLVDCSSTSTLMTRFITSVSRLTRIFAVRQPAGSWPTLLPRARQCFGRDIHKFYCVSLEGKGKFRDSDTNDARKVFDRLFRLTRLDRCHWLLLETRLLR